MLIYSDGAQLEWRVVAELSGDKQAIKEINEGLDTHTDNQEKFNLPTRLVAKTFLYRAIFKGTAPAYAQDPEFMHVSTKADYWQGVIDAFYDKYSSIANFHSKIIKDALRHGEIQNPISGRRHVFTKVLRRGVEEYSENDIVNYPVQSLGADIIACSRVHIRQRLKEEGLLNKEVYPVLTVHDSVIYDVVNDYDTIIHTSEIIKDCFTSVQDFWEQRYGFRLKVPHDCEVKVGKNWGNLDTIYKDGKWKFDVVEGLLNGRDSKTY